MSPPLRMLVLMLLTLVAVAAGGVLAGAPLFAALQAAPAAPALIGGVLVVGIAVQLAHTAALVPATGWVDQTRRGFAAKVPPRLIAPLAQVLAGREREGFTVSLPGMRALMETARERLEPPRTTVWMLGALLLVIGIGGALWPLALGQGAPQLVSAILALAAAGTLVTLHLQVRYAQHAFLATLEELLAERAELPSGLIGAETSLPGYLEGLLRQAAESLADQQRLMVRADEERAGTQAAIRAVTAELANLSDQLRAEHKVIIALSKNHTDLQPLMQDFTRELARGLAAGEELRSHVRRIDLALERLLEDVGQLRDELPGALRQEARVLAQTALGRVKGREPLATAE